MVGCPPGIEAYLSRLIGFFAHQYSSGYNFAAPFPCPDVIAAMLKKRIVSSGRELHSMLVM